MYKRGGKQQPKDTPSTSKTATATDDGVVNLVVHFPFIKTTEPDVVPTYYDILKRTDTKSMEMELNGLQMDLEKLLSSVVIRNRIFKTEIKLIEKRNKLVEHQVTPGTKRKKHNEKLINEKQTLQKISKSHYDFEAGKSNQSGSSKCVDNLAIPLEERAQRVIPELKIPKVTFPRNDCANRFWFMVNEYCRPVTTEDVNFIDQLIEEHKEEHELKMPELGQHYSYEWGDNDLSFLDKNGEPKKGIDPNDPVDSTTMKLNSIPGPLTQRLVLALMEDNSIPNNNVQHRFQSRQTMKVNRGLTDALCIERRLRKELVEVGILEPSDLADNGSDTIEEEMKRVHQELLAVSRQNSDILKELKENVQAELQRQRVQRQLEKVDKKIINQYNEIMANKIKDGEVPEEVAEFTHKLILKQQELCKEMEQTTPKNMRFLPTD